MPDRSWLDVSMKHRLGRFTLDAAFALDAPWTVLFGASGSGKTTILRAVQGHLRPQECLIQAGESILADSSRGAFLPPHARRVRSAAQVERLFPKMTVRQNLEWAGALNTTDNCPLVDELLHMFHVEPFARNYPDALSGGERQRISVARAVLSAAVCPRAILLLDEPFSGLGLALRDDLAGKLRVWLQARAIPVLSVTHDVSEAFLLKAYVLRLQDGRIVDRGPVDRVLATERGRLLALLGP